jgi:hypothetical protein
MDQPLRDIIAPDEMIDYLFLFLGVVNIIWGTILFVMTRKFFENSSKSLATIIKKEAGNQGHPVYTLKFKNNSGAEVESTSNLSAKRRNIGETCEIVYSTKNNKKIKLNTFWGIWITPVIMFSSLISLVISYGIIKYFNLY